MKKLALWLMLAVMFFAALTAGCGGGSDSSAPEQTESLTDDTGSTDPNSGGRGNSDAPVDLSKITADYTAKNGEVLTGKLGSQVKISVADGATITLRDVTIEGRVHKSSMWAGLTCNGNATLILEGTNTVKVFHWYHPAIYIPSGHTLTIKGNGALTADASASYAAGIGGGRKLSCGNIVIEGGTIVAIGGSGAHFECSGAGIGSGGESECGNITIKETVTKVTASKGRYAKHSIGAGQEGRCGTVTIGRKTGPIEESPHTYEGNIELSRVTENYIAKDGAILTGELGGKHKISIAEGATVILHDVTINGADDISCPWAGINCEGDATLILESSNSVKGFHSYSPGIHVKPNKTLTIKGKGSLAASSTGWAAGIGGGSFIPCGNIVIEGGTITATGGNWAAGIGGGYGASCGSITISSGIITATRGSSAPYSVGAGGGGGICGTITIDGVVTDPISKDKFTYDNRTVNLSKVTENYTVEDGETLTGTLGANVKISIANGATVTLKDANINGVDEWSCNWAGLTCDGNAVIILEGTNSMKGFNHRYPGIFVPRWKTLTIKGSGSLDASSNGWAAGIGGEYEKSCGNIVIEGGTITATGGKEAAGIGGGSWYDCGYIIIRDTVTKVTATKGEYAQHSIGAGRYASCGTVTIGGQNGPIYASPYTYPPDAQ